MVKSIFPVPTVSVNSGMDQEDSPTTSEAAALGCKKTPVESWEDVADNSTASGMSGAAGGEAGHSHASTPDGEASV